MAAVQIEVKRLSPAIQAALRSVGYGARDIAVRPATEVSLTVGGGAGMRGFAMLVDMHTGRHETMRGSWGGANMFNPQNRVDLDTTLRPLPPGTVLIKGTEGHPRTIATIYAHPDTMGSFALAGPQAEVSADERTVLNVYRGIISSYRQSEFARRGLSRHQVAAATERLIALGLLKRNAAGAVQITTAGKNAASPPGTFRRRGTGLLRPRSRANRRVGR